MIEQRPSQIWIYIAFNVKIRGFTTNYWMLYVFYSRIARVGDYNHVKGCDVTGSRIQSAERANALAADCIPPRQ